MEAGDVDARKRLPTARARPAAARSPLRSVHLFADLSAERVAAIAQLCSWRTWQAGETVLNHLEAGDEVFFLVEGKARASVYSLTGKSVSFCELTGGEMFGEYAAIDGGPRSASIEAVSKCVIGCMPGASFRALLQSEPSLAMKLLHQCVGKIRALSTRIYEFSTLAVSNRIHAEILRLARLAEAADGSSEINPVPTHAEIASRTSTHREAVTRELNRLVRAGVVERRGRTLWVKDVARLAHLVHEATGE